MRKQSDGVDRFRAVGVGKIDFGTANLANAGNDGFPVLYYPATAHDRVQREML